jgi:hypothetical protein
MTDNEMRDDLDPTTEFSREQDAAEFSPAQPEVHRIDDDENRNDATRAAGTDDEPGTPHTKHERTGRMTH